MIRAKSPWGSTFHFTSEMLEATALAAARSRFSLAVDCESQKQVAGLSDDTAVAGICIEYAVGDCRAAAIYGAALRLTSIHCCYRLGRVIVPDDRTVFGRVSAQVSVHGAGKNHARNDGRSCRLRVVAAHRSPTAIRRWGRYVPKLLAGRTAQCSNAGFATWSRLIRDGNIDVLLIGCKSPLDAAQRAAGAQPHLPQNLALMIRIKRINHPRFLAGQDHLFAARKCAQNRRAAKVVIRPSIFRAVAHTWLPTAHQEVVFGTDLIHPF